MVKNFHEPGLGPEHPYGDFIQFLMFILFFLVWGLDSLIFEFFQLNTLVPFFFRLVFSILFLFLGGYLVFRSHFVIFREKEMEELVETGVYSFVRHPMYLGGLFFFFGFVVLTLSVLSFFVWCGMVVVYDWLATYEEKELNRIVGEEYEEYRAEVSKWIPYIL